MTTTLPTSGPIISAGDGEYHTGIPVTSVTIEVGSSGSGITIVAKPRYITTGNITPSAHGSWTALTGFELSIPAVVGDWLELSANFMVQPNTSSFFDFAVISGSTIQRFFASGSSSPGLEGNPGMYPQNSFRPFNGTWAFQVAAGDLDTDSVRLCLVHKGAASGTVFADSNYPFYWCVRNFGAVTVL